jgi:3-methyladenine DNA glycosylase AlkD
MLQELKKELQKASNKEKAKDLQRFFKTGPGEYGEGDIFLGLSVPEQRRIAKKYYDLDLKQIKELMESKIHEYRLIALLILINKYETTNHKKIITHFYLKNTNNINNWDLVDLSAPNIVGKHLLDKERSVLYKLAKSKNLWEKRIAVLACFAFIRENDFKDALKISKILLNDKHDLIHKAVGWMLREIGKRNQKVEEDFLKKYYKIMPRTMLRYAIEKFPEEKRKFYLKK